MRQFILSITTVISLISLGGKPVIGNEEFERLRQVLQHHQIEVVVALPPLRGAYGLFEVRSAKIWINPVVFELGIARQTLIHEAVHGAQYCATQQYLTQQGTSLGNTDGNNINGNNNQEAIVLRPLGLELDPPSIVQPYFLRYHDLHHRQVEAEAYTIQVQPAGVDMAIELLQRHCP
jgi:hypothetical protein